MIKRFMLAIAAVIFLASNSLAADYSGHFGDMDADGDGIVTWQEFQGHFPQAEEQAFAGADADRSNGLDHDEWHAFKQAYGYGHGPENGEGYHRNQGAGAGSGQGMGSGHGLGAGQGCDKNS